jgi:transcriptional regulator with XRE-family HTH domain
MFSQRMRGGAIVREARRRAGLTQVQLADRAGTRQSAIARLERGTAEPAFRKVADLVAACGLELRIGVQEPRSVPDVDPPALGPLGALLRRGVTCVIAGRTAAALRGVALLAPTPCIVPEESLNNLVRLAEALGDVAARIRTDDGAGSLPMDRTAPGLTERRAWPLSTVEGDVDVRFSPAGTYGYPDLVRDATELSGRSGPLVVASLEDAVRQLEAEDDDPDVLAIARRALQ